MLPVVSEIPLEDRQARPRQNSVPAFVGCPVGASAWDGIQLAVMTDIGCSSCLTRGSAARVAMFPEPPENSREDSNRYKLLPCQAGGLLSVPSSSMPRLERFCAKGKPVPVGYRAFLLMTAFLKRPGEVLTKSDLYGRGLAGSGRRGDESIGSDRVAAEASWAGAGGRRLDRDGPAGGLPFRGRRRRRIGRRSTSAGASPAREPEVDHRSPSSPSSISATTGARLFRRWHSGGHHHRSLAAALAFRHRAQFHLPLQGQGS